MTNKRYAGVDIGSGSARLAICELENGSLKTKYFELFRHSLGQDNKKYGKLTEETMQQALATFAKIVDLCKKFNVSNLEFGATEAIRAASNSAEFLDRVLKELGIQIRILDEQEEATFAYLGAKKLFNKAANSVLVMDIGRGSIELALGSVKHEIPTEYISHKLGTMVFRDRLNDKSNLDSLFTKIIEDIENDFSSTLNNWQASLLNGQVIGLGMSLFTYGYIKGYSEKEMVKAEGLELSLTEVKQYAQEQLQNLKNDINHKETKGVISQGDIPVLATLIALMQASKLDKITLGRTRIPQGIAQQLSQKD